MLLVLQQNMLLGEAADLVEVPDVVGQTQASGTTELQTALFVVAVAQAYSNVVPAGSIISQSPTAGSMAFEGWTVTITVSIGAQTVVPAGSSKRKHHKRRQYVEIDGQSFEVASAQEALDLLQRARALAEREAESAAEQAAKAVPRGTKVRPVEVKAPEITASPEIAQDLAPIIADIQRLYAKAAETAELRMLLERQMDEEDEDELILLL